MDRQQFGTYVGVRSAGGLHDDSICWVSPGYNLIRAVRRGVYEITHADWGYRGGAEEVQDRSVISFQGREMDRRTAEPPRGNHSIEQPPPRQVFLYRISSLARRVIGPGPDEQLQCHRRPTATDILA